MVCLNCGQPKILDDSGFKALIDPIICQLKIQEIIDERNLLEENKNKSNLIQDQMENI